MLDKTEMENFQTKDNDPAINQAPLLSAHLESSIDNNLHFGKHVQQTLTQQKTAPQCHTVLT